MNKIHIVLLSGGSGTRLWPLSNEARSKQFLKVLRNEDGEHVSMVQRVFDQISRMVPGADVTVATGASQVRSLEMQVRGRYAEVVEPERRDTAPAIMLACEHLASEQGAGTGDPVVVMPIDSYVEDAYFEKVLEVSRAVGDGAADMVLLGVEPTYPSEKYGYIVPEACDGASVLAVSRFTEKPEEAEAEGLISQGALWNCGVFGFRLGYALGILARYGSFASYGDLRARYGELPRNSFDYEVVERAESVAVIPYAGDWKDLGTWNTLTEEMPDASAGRVAGIETCDNTHVINELHMPLVALGLKDAVVVASPDGILVSDKHQSSYMKPFVQRVAEERPMVERRSWGEYRVIESIAFSDGAKCLVKEMTVEPGGQICYQRHEGRDEQWTVVSGEGELVVNGAVIPIRAGSAFRINRGDLHGARAISRLRIVEIQLGEVLAEDDVERFGYYWQPEEKTEG